MKRFLVLLLVLLCSFSLAHAANEFYEFETAAQERKFNQLTRELRCPKCQNQSIADSDAPLAMDMRERVYQMVMAGDSREEIIDFMKLRYGDFVHYKPPIKPSTIILWLAPSLVIVLGAITVIVNLRGQNKAVVHLSAEEQERLDTLMREEQEDEAPESRRNEEQND